MQTINQNIPILPYTSQATPKPTARLEARIPQELHAILKYAANIEGRSVTDFVITAIRKAADDTIEKASITRLAVEDQKLFAQTLLTPPEPNEALRKAMEQHQRLVHND